MRKRMKWGFVALVALVMLTLAACSSTDKTLFSEGEESRFMDDLTEQAMKPEEPNVIAKIVDANIARLSDTGASNAVDTLMYTLYQKMPDLNKKAQGMADALDKAQAEGVVFTDNNAVSRLKDITLKAFLEELNTNSYLVVKQNGIHQVVPDIATISKKYESYLLPDLKAMLMFTQEEYEHSFFDDATSTFDYDLIVDRILSMEKAAADFPNSIYTNGFNESRSYYVQIYFGSSSKDLLVDSKGKVLPEVISSYKKVISEHPDTQLAKDVESVLAKLATTGDMYNDDMIVFVSELTTLKTADPVTSDSSGDTETAEQPPDLQEALKQAIDDNSKQ